MQQSFDLYTIWEKERDLIKQRRLRAVARLCELANSLASGEKRQASCLKSLSPLLTERTGDYEFFGFLLEKSFARYRAGDTLLDSVQTNDVRKTELFQRLLEICQPLIEWRKTRANHGEIEEALPRLKQLVQDLERDFPGTKRIWVHASRRRISDPDLLLLENLANVMSAAYPADRNMTWWTYKLACVYICDYRRLRFIPNDRSAARVMDIADYWSLKHFGKTARDALLEAGVSPTRGGRKSRASKA
jgi:hypothetical protein